MPSSLDSLVAAYDAAAPLERACTPPAAWYTDPRVAELERAAVFARSWQLVARLDQLTQPGCFVTANIAGEPVVVVRGRDQKLRAFYNVCRHHAAEVVTAAEGKSHNLRCPYHGWTYSLEGALRGCPEFSEVRDFDQARNGLSPVALDTWEQFVFVRLSNGGPSLREHVGSMAERVALLRLSALKFYARRTYDLKCNWKVFVDNYLDGGYHVPHIHKGLNSVLDYQEYRIETADRYCLQSSPITSAGGEAETASVRGGQTAYYYWLYPNLMLNWYEGYLDTNLVLPLDVDHCRVIFDFYFADADPESQPGAAGPHKDRSETGTTSTAGAAVPHQDGSKIRPTSQAERCRSVAVAERVQQEDIDICESVQRGLGSRSYDVGRLSVRREAGEHLFHRLLAADLRAALQHENPVNNL